MSATSQSPPYVSDTPYYYSTQLTGNEYLDELIDCYWLKYQDNKEWFTKLRNELLEKLVRDDRWFPSEQEMTKYRKETCLVD